MQGEWKVSSNFLNGKQMFTVYRLRNVDEVDHSGNREYYGGYTDSKEEAQELADYLNSKE